ncbi:MAG: hypothetical protein ACI9OJ_000664 [Myxococcota bacterium]|jgi:hypothetical protein
MPRLRISATSTVWIAVLLFSGCRDSAPIPEDPAVPALREPVSHAPEPVAVLPPERRKRVLPAPAPPPITRPAERIAPRPEDEEPPTIQVPDEPEEIPPKVDTPESPEDEALAWLRDASDVRPGCLRGGPAPRLMLPSPKALAYIMRSHPTGFGGVAREALVCIIGLPRLTEAEVFGSSAFRPAAIDTSILLAGGERELGVVTAIVQTDEPAMVGAVVLALDKRASGWSIRAAAWIPWEGDRRSLEIEQVSDAKLLTRRRKGLDLTLADRHKTMVHHVALTTTEKLVPVLGLTTRRNGGGQPKLVGKRHVRGKGWPRTVVYRALETDLDGSVAWIHETLEAERDRPYVSRGLRRGLVELGAVIDLLEDGERRDAAWLWGQLPKATKKSANAQAARARIEAKAGKHRRAVRYWKRALKAADAPAELHRDYGRYLISRKRRKTGRSQLRKYLEKSPEAADRADVEAEIGGG